MTVEMKPLPSDLIDALLADYKKPEDLIGQNGLLKQLTKALVERALQAEMTDHLGHGKNQLVANEAGNTRNGRSRKTLKGCRRSGASCRPGPADSRDGFNQRGSLDPKGRHIAALDMTPSSTHALRPSLADHPWRRMHATS